MKYTKVSMAADVALAGVLGLNVWHSAHMPAAFAFCAGAFAWIVLMRLGMIREMGR